MISHVRAGRIDSGRTRLGPGFDSFSLTLRQLFTWIRARAQSLGIGIDRYWPRPPGNNVLALAISDVLLRKIIAGGSLSDFTFIQIGANDGRTNDPIRRLVLKFGLRGILVEPQPDAFARLVHNYSNAPQLAFENAAIAQAKGQATLYRFKPGPGVPDWADCLASFSREHLIRNLADVKGEIEEVVVPTMSFTDLIRKHGLTEVDLLQIDTEGFDFEVIKLIDFDAFRPSIINFEQGLLIGKVRQECYQYLGKRSYKITENGVDAVAYLEPPDQAQPETGVPVD